MAVLYTVQIMRLVLDHKPPASKLMITCKVTNVYPNKKSSDRMMREAKSQMNYQVILLLFKLYGADLDMSPCRMQKQDLFLFLKEVKRKKHLGSSISFLGKALILRFLCFRMLEPSELGRRENLMLCRFAPHFW